MCTVHLRRLFGYSPIPSPHPDRCFASSCRPFPCRPTATHTAEAFTCNTLGLRCTHSSSRGTRQPTRFQSHGFSPPHWWWADGSTPRQYRLRTGSSDTSTYSAATVAESAGLRWPEQRRGGVGGDCLAGRHVSSRRAVAVDKILLCFVLVPPTFPRCNFYRSYRTLASLGRVTSMIWYPTKRRCVFSRMHGTTELL